MLTPLATLNITSYKTSVRAQRHQPGGSQIRTSNASSNATSIGDIGAVVDTRRDAGHAVRVVAADTRAAPLLEIRVGGGLVRGVDDLVEFLQTLRGQAWGCQSRSKGDII